MKRLITTSSMAVLFSCLSLPAIADQDAGSNDPSERTHRSEGRRAGGGERWKQLDQDSDGKISRSEWKRDPQAFDRMDADKDGFLTREEMQAAAHEFRRKGRNGLKEMDTDGDGNISRNEWKGKEETFHRLDANNDGLVTRDELRQARKHRGPGSHRRPDGDKTTL